MSAGLGPHRGRPRPPAIEPSPGPAPLRESDIFALAPRGLLEAAADYLLLERVQRPRRRRSLLAAEVEGTDDVHRVRVRCERQDALSLSPSCSCPAGRPYCKHVLALLLLWVRDPQAFTAVDALEEAAACLPAAVAAEALADAAMGADPLDALRESAAGREWSVAPPGRCLEAWPAVRRVAQSAGAWPEAAFAVARRIAGVPASPAPGHTVAGGPLAVRQLTWWLTLVAPDLPAPALLPWLQHLFRLLESGGAPAAPEEAVWLARLAVALPPERTAESRWIARFAAAAPVLAPVFEAELRRVLWEAEVAWRLAAGAGRQHTGADPADLPPAGARPDSPLAAARPALLSAPGIAVARARDALEAFAAEAAATIVPSPRPLVQ